MHKRPIDADKVTQSASSARQTDETAVVATVEKAVLTRGTLGAANGGLDGYLVANLESPLVWGFGANLDNSTGEFVAEAHRHRLASRGMWMLLGWDESRSRVLVKICAANTNESGSSVHCVSRTSSVDNEHLLHLDLVVSAFRFVDVVDAEISGAVVS